MVKALDSQPMDLLFKSTGWLKVNSAVHTYEVDQMSTRNF